MEGVSIFNHPVRNCVLRGQGISGVTSSMRYGNLFLSWEKLPLSLSHMERYEMDEKEELFHWKL